MGLNRELRNINAELLTAKQERQLERLENKQKKELEQDLQSFLIYHFKQYFNISFVIYKNKIFTNSFKTQLKKGALAELGFYKSNEYLLLIFDDVYIKTAKKTIKNYELFNATANESPPAPSENISNFHPLQDFFLFLLAVFGIVNALTGSVKKRR